MCFDETKRKTKGKCWKAIGDGNISQAKNYMEDREGRLTQCDVKLIDGRVVKAWCGNTYPDLMDKSAREIARLALESEKKASPGRGGVTYLKESKRIGIKTPLMNKILKEIEK